MKAKEMNNKSDKELQALAADNQKKLQQLHIDYRTQEVKNVKQIHLVKKDIARIKTVLRSREMDKKGVKNG
jgi:large subunit ribosomal protein L29